MNYDTYTDEHARADACDRAARDWTADAIRQACEGAALAIVRGSLRVAMAYRRIARDARTAASVYARA